LSDDATDLVQGQVIGIGAYPFIRANLVACVGCSPGTVTLRASYTGTSSIPGNAYGFYNPSQQIRKALFVAQALGTGLTILGVPAPYGSASGFIIFNSNSSLPANSSIQIIIHYGNLQAVTVTFAIPNAFAGGTLSVSEPSIPATSVDVVVNDGGVSSNRTISAYYFFYPPGQLVPGVQPISWIGESAATFNMLSSNQEIVSALNTAVSIDLDVSATATAKTQRASLFKVSARCSAGSAQLTVTDGGTTNTLAGSGNGQIYSTAATEVGTTTFRESWNPGLSSSPSTGLHITLGTCGAGNAGTLDVQGSVF
jgi:hypothetical protein